MSINQRIKILVETFAEDSPTQFGKQIGVSHTTVTSLLPGGRESKPGYEILVKIIDAFPRINTNWLLLGEGDMLIKNINIMPKFSNTNENSNAKIFSKEIFFPTTDIYIVYEQMKKDYDALQKEVIELRVKLAVYEKTSSST